MKKNLFLTAAFLLASGSFYAQVGINTETPAATLDVVGQPQIAETMDGIIAPRITGDQLFQKYYDFDQRGAMVYVTEAAGLEN